MQSFDVAGMEVQRHQPVVIESENEGRAIVLELPAGEKLQEHQVHERGWLMVVSGVVEVDDSDGKTVSGGAGWLATFAPNERREIRATQDARLLLILSPWPGEGHPSGAI